MPTSLVVECAFCLKNDKIVCKSNNCFIYIYIFFSSRLISVARIKYSVRSKTMWGVQGLLTYTSRSQFIMEKSQSRNLRQETGRSEPTVSPSSSLQAHPRTSCLRVVLTTVRWVLLQQSGQPPTDVPTGQSGLNNSSAETWPSHASKLCQVDKVNQTDLLLTADLCTYFIYLRIGGYL